jgi:hypothetical protein
MFGANAQLIATRCVQSFRGRVFSVRSLVQHTSDRKWSEHSLFGVRADNRSVDTSSQISGPNHALTLSFNLLIDSFKDTFWRACGRGSRIVWSKIVLFPHGSCRSGSDETPCRKTRMFDTHGSQDGFRSAVHDDSWRTPVQSVRGVLQLPECWYFHSFPHVRRCDGSRVRMNTYHSRSGNIFRQIQSSSPFYQSWELPSMPTIYRIDLNVNY